MRELRASSPSQELETQGRGLWTASFLAIAIYFIIFAADGLGAYFTPDDGGNLVNMHEVWEQSIADMAKSALHLVTGAYRPLGGIYYLVLYKFAGFSPLPFRAVCLFLMLVNLLLAFSVLARLSGSIETAFLGCSLMALHPALFWLFYSSGTVYEILCFLFYFLTVLLCLRWRRQGIVILDWKRLILLLALAACALNSKEMAMTLPATLLLIEVMNFPPKWQSWRDAVHFAIREGRAPLAVALLTMPVVAAKLLTANVLSNDPRYHVQSVHNVIDSMRGYQNALLYRDLYHNGLTATGLVLVWVTMAVIAVAFDSRPMKIGILLLITTLAPVLTIGPRGGYMLYLPLVGWALFGGAFLSAACDGLTRLASPVRFRGALRLAVVLTVAVAIGVGHARLRAPQIALVHHENEEVRRVLRQLREMYPRFDGDKFLLLQTDVLPRGWGFSFFVQLAYNNPGILIERSDMKGLSLKATEMNLYDHIFVDDGSRLHEAPTPWKSRVQRAPLELQFSPARVRPGETFTISVPEFAGQTIDVAICSKRRASYLTVARRWCTLNGSGRASFEMPQLPSQSISALQVRTQEGEWIPVQGAIDVVR